MNVAITLFLCIQLINVCVYIPSWMYPGPSKADLTESVVELLLEAVLDDSMIMSDYQTEGSASFPTLNEEVMQEDLHAADTEGFDFSLFASSQVRHNHYHYTADIKTHVFSVVYPPPDFC